MNILKEIFWEMPADMWKDGALGKFIVSMLGSVLVMVFLLVLVGTYEVVDRAFLTYQEGNATVISKSIDPAHSETTYQTMIVGKTTMMIPQTTNYPNRFYLRLEVEGTQGTRQVNKSEYDEISEGKIVTVHYSKRRLSNEMSFE